MSLSYFIFRKSGGADGAIAAHIDNILGRGELDVLCRVRIFPEHRNWDLGVQEKSFARAGMAPYRAGDFSAQLAQ